MAKSNRTDFRNERCLSKLFRNDDCGFFCNDAEIPLYKRLEFRNDVNKLWQRSAQSWKIDVNATNVICIYFRELRYKIFPFSYSDDWRSIRLHIFVVKEKTWHCNRLSRNIHIIVRMTSHLLLHKSSIRNISKKGLKYTTSNIIELVANSEHFQWLAFVKTTPNNNKMSQSSLRSPERQIETFSGYHFGAWFALTKNVKLSLNRRF